MPAAYLDGLSVEHTEDRLRQWLFNEGEAADEGRVYVLYVLPGHQRKGIGRGLMRACAAHLLTQGMRSLIVWVLKENPYRRFYESLGGALVE